MSAPNAGGITLFTAPKPFVGHIGVIQRNALRSWAALGSRVELVVFGDEEGAAAAAAEAGARHLTGLERNPQGTPLLNEIFERAAEAASFDRLAYLNADVMLLDDFLPAADRVAQAFSRYLIVGQRWDLSVDNLVDVSPSSLQAIRVRLDHDGRRHPPAGSDYFVFPRGAFPSLPPFAVGRAGWDNWMIYAARHAGWPVIDASETITIIHQDHDYAHLPGGQAHYRLPESERNVELAGGRETIFTLKDATWRMTSEEFHKVGPVRAGVRRWLEAGLISRWGSGRLARLVRLAFHPMHTLRYLRAHWVGGPAPAFRQEAGPYGPSDASEGPK
jgi:hypothetical protein